MTEAQRIARNERWYRLETARIQREQRERAAYVRGEPTRVELRENGARRQASSGGARSRRNRPRRNDGAFMDEQPGADFLRRALGGDSYSSWD